MQLTYKFRISDNAANELGRQSRAVNFVWNYCNDVQRQALKWGKKWPSFHDLQKLTAGSSKELDIHAHTIQQVCQQYERSRKQHRKASLRWREGVRHNFIKREYDEDNRCIVYLLGSRGRHAIEEAQIAEQIKRRDPDLLLERIAELESQLALANSALRASMQLNEELINDSGEDESPGKFMVSVDGAGAPRHIHNSEEEARVEAMRLAELATNVTKPVRVLKLVDTLIVSTSTVKTAQWSSELGENEAPANSTEQCGHCKEQCRA